METIVKTDNSYESQKIDEKYILSINDRNSLLICLNQLLTNPPKSDLNDVLLQIHCNHFDDYVKYVSAKVIIDYIFKRQLSLNFVFESKYWNSFSHLCQFLSTLSTKISIKECNGFESIIDELSNKLVNWSQSEDLLSEDQCLCHVFDTVLQVFPHINDENINTFLSNVTKLLTKEKKRCFVYKLIDIMINIMKQKEENPVLMKTISVWVIQQNFLTERINFSNVLYSFGGKYLSDNDFGCDVILLRQSVHLFLITLSSEYVLKSYSDIDIKDKLRAVEEFVRNKCKKFDENDWIVKLFIEEDEQLLSAVFCLIRLGDNQLSHFIMSSLIESIDFDSSVLLDMLCDEQTATLLLKIFLFYLKLSDILTEISINVKNVFLELSEKMEKLTAKQLFPYNVKPLIKLLNKLKN